MNTTSVSTDTIQLFFKHYHDLKDQFAGERAGKDMASFTAFFNRYHPINALHQKRLRDTAPGYNIFDILRIQRRETKVHTPFLKHLLSPHETHGQGRLFFDLFMEQILSERYDKTAVGAIDVREEWCFAGGRIDILMFYTQAGARKVMVIENKIDATDGKEQLGQYYGYLSGTLGFGDQDLHIAYLKPHACPPSDYSLTKELYARLTGIGSLTCMGYHQDIRPMLEKALPLVQAPILRFSLQQYLTTVKSL